VSLWSWGRSTPAAIATLLLGFVLGCIGFFRFLPRFASDNNDLMLEVAKRQAEGRMAGEAAVTGPVALTALAPLMFVLTTPLGWLSAYLVLTGTARCITAAVREPRGDPVLGLARRAALRWRTRRADERERTVRTLAEGPDVADRLATADRFGIEGADLVVVASRRKPEWTFGTILDCGERFYRVGEPDERTLPGGLRTLYPLTEAPHAGVFRRIVRYDLPALQPDRPKG
jgi:hypothetical protein